jgi:hypothetical protein
VIIRLPRAGFVAAALGLLLATGVVGCAPAVTSPTSAAQMTPVTSPVIGRVIAIDSEGLTKVRGFTLRTAAGMEIPFVIGVLENGAAFPPGHLAEHMATASEVRAWYRDAGGQRVVYRLEDADGG